MAKPPHPPQQQPPQQKKPKCEARNHNDMPEHRVPDAVVRGFVLMPWWDEAERVWYCKDCRDLMTKLGWFVSDAQVMSTKIKPHHKDRDTK